jgi:ribosomal protein S8
MRYNSYAFLINHINILTTSKKRSLIIRYNNKILTLAYLLKSVGCLNSVVVISKSRKLLKISTLFYKNKSFYRGVKLLSTPSKSFFVKLKTLKLLHKSLGNSVLVLETSKGLVTHTLALRMQVSGKLLCILS